MRNRIAMENHNKQFVSQYFPSERGMLQVGPNMKKSREKYLQDPLQANSLLSPSPPPCFLACHCCLNTENISNNQFAC